METVLYNGQTQVVDQPCASGWNPHKNVIPLGIPVVGSLCDRIRLHYDLGVAKMVASGSGTCGFRPFFDGHTTLLEET